MKSKLQPPTKESQTIEYKESWRDEYLRWISGFANAEGGVLVIGRNDNGDIIGLKNARKLLEDIPNKVRDILGIMVDVNLRSAAKKEFLEIVVNPYPCPVSYKGEYHYRSGSTKQELKGAALDRFLLRKYGRRWDGVPVPKVSVKALDRQVLKRFRERALRSKRLSNEILAESDTGLIQKLHLKEAHYLKRAAILLFHPDPERFVTGAYIKIGRFRTNSDLLYHDEIHGDLFTQVDKTMDLLLTKYLSAAISYEGVQRVETYPVPEEALREALLNAVAHKDYGSSVPIQISVYDDKIMLWNNGELYEGWTVKTLLGKHSSEPPNPDIANAFFRAGMIECWGRGIDYIMSECRVAGVRHPKFRYEGGGLWVEFLMSGAAQIIEEHRLGEKLVERLGENRSKIVVAIRKDPRITVAELAEQLGISDTAVENNLRSLKKQGIIARIGAAKGGYWQVLEPAIGKDQEGGGAEKPNGGLGEKSGDKLGENRSTILAAIKNNPKISIKKLAVLLDLSTTAIENNLRVLTFQGYIKHIGPTKGGHWEVLS